MEQLHTRLRTWFRSARWARRWRSPRGDVATASAGAGGLPGQPPRRTRGSPRHRLRLRAGIGRRLRPVPRRAPDGAGAGRPRRGAGARSRGREGASLPRPHPGATLRAGAALVPRRPGTPSGSSPCGGTGPPTGWWSPRRPGPQRDSRISLRRGWSPSSIRTEAPAPSSRPLRPGGLGAGVRRPGPRRPARGRTRHTKRMTRR